MGQYLNIIPDEMNKMIKEIDQANTGLIERDDWLNFIQQERKIMVMEVVELNNHNDHKIEYDDINKINNVTSNYLVPNNIDKEEIIIKNDVKSNYLVPNLGQSITIVSRVNSQDITRSNSRQTNISSISDDQINKEFSDNINLFCKESIIISNSDNDFDSCYEE